MFPKFLMFLLFGLALANPDYSVQNNYSKQRFDIVQQLKNLLALIAETIQVGVETAIDEFSKILNEIIAVGTSLISETMRIITGTIAGTVGGIMNLVDEAKDLGVDVTECLGENLQNIKDIPDDAIQGAIQCVEKNIEDCNNAISNGIKKISSVVVVEDIWNDFWRCSGFWTLACWTRVVTETGLKLTKLPFVIAAETAKVTAHLIANQGKLVICQTNTVAQATEDSARLSLVVINCINEKMHAAGVYFH